MIHWPGLVTSPGLAYFPFTSLGIPSYASLRWWHDSVGRTILFCFNFEYSLTSKDPGNHNSCLKHPANNSDFRRSPVNSPCAAGSSTEKEGVRGGHGGRMVIQGGPRCELGVDGWYGHGRQVKGGENHSGGLRPSSSLRLVLWRGPGPALLTTSSIAYAKEEGRWPTHPTDLRCEEKRYHLSLGFSGRRPQRGERRD